MRFRQKALAVKMESTYGTDPTPATGTDDILILKDMEVVPVDQDEVPRDIVRVEKGNDEILPTNAKVRLTGGVEIAGGGGAGTTPAYSALLRACGLAATVTADTDVTYDPVSTGEESVAAYFYRGTNLHKAVGMRGNVRMAFQASQPPRFNFDMMGLYVAVANATFPSNMDYSDFVKPIHVNDDNTTFSLFGYAAIMASLNLDLGNQVAEDSMVNSRTIEIADRRPTGEAVIELPAQTAKDFFALLVAGTTGALQIVHGTTAGNIVQVDAPAVQLTGQPSYSESNGKAHMRFPFQLLPSSGDDEIAIEVK